MKKLKVEYLEIIKTDALLAGKVADEAGVSIFSMQRLIKNNSPKFTRPRVQEVIKKHLGLSKSVTLTDSAVKI